MSGLKKVRRRYRDALSRLRWDQLESLLAAHYRDRGYTVDHCGTGAGGRRFDGGVDLRLRRGGEVVLVQCKHWNARQVPHNAVHELLGVMVNEGASGAVLVTSGEFTGAARHAATRHGHVQLVDGTTLRTMLGPLPEPASAVFDTLALSATREAGRISAAVAREAGERLWFGGGGSRVALRETHGGGVGHEPDGGPAAEAGRTRVPDAGRVVRAAAHSSGDRRSGASTATTGRRGRAIHAAARVAAVAYGLIAHGARRDAGKRALPRIDRRAIADVHRPLPAPARRHA